MSPHSSPSGGPPEGTPFGAPDINEALRAVRALAVGQYELLGPLGQDARREFVFLARDPARDRLVVLKRNWAGRDSGARTAELRVIDQLDSSVPPPAGSCPICQTPFGSWDPVCPECGADIAGAAAVPPPGMAQSEWLASIQQAAPGYQVLGEMRRAVGSGPVYFARHLASGDLVALRLDPETGPGRQSQYTVAATHMMRPKLLYGTVGGDSSREPGAPSVGGHRPWTPVPSPPVPTPAGFRSGAPVHDASLSGADAGDKVCPQCGDVFGPELRFCPRDGAALRPKARPDDLVGQVIADRYHILDRLGEGGMGMVYLAEHVRMGRRCAVKVMNPILLHDPDSVSRFNREAANASRINHANVAAVYDFGETPEGIVYLAMEFVEGESLAATLERERALPQRRAVAIGKQVAEALEAAQELGIVHRDLKPDNVMLARSRSGADLVKVVDFGIAKVTQGARQTVTRTGYVLGTPAYMSPEQILGDVLDGRSDVYSLGCILYEMLTGERAFAGPSGEVSIHQRLTEPPPRPRRTRRDLSSKLDEIVTRAMARSPDQRFQSAGALRDALSDVLAEAPTRSGWRRWLPWGRSPATQATASAEPTQLSGPRPAGTAPVPLGWSEAVQPPPPAVGHGTTLLRHRSARPKSRNPGIIAAAGVGAVALGFVLWKVFGPHEDRVKESPSPIVPVAPAPGVPSAVVPPVQTAKGAESSPPPAVPPADLPGEIRFTQAMPPEARVTIDGQPASLSSAGALSVPPGHHSIGVRARGFEPATHEVDVAPGETTLVSLELIPVRRPAPAQPPVATERPAPAPASGSLIIEGTLPQGAEIAVDGQPLAPGARAVTLAPGTHLVRLSAPGYIADSFLVRVNSGGPTPWPAPDLQQIPKPGPKPEPAPVTPAPAPAPRPPAPALPDYSAEVRQALADYVAAINARDIGRLKNLYPTMSPDREQQWRDLFRKEVKDLKATLSGAAIQATGPAPQASFTLTLSFKPDRDKAQTYRINVKATLTQAPAGWRFLQLVETGE